jgi:hypothetical protein
MEAMTGTVLIALCGVALLGSAGTKLAGVKGAVRALENNGFAGRVALIGAGEALSAALFLIPQTRPIGLLLVSAHLGGAIATHMQHRQSIVPPAAFLGAVWLGVWLNHASLVAQLAGAR